MAQKELDGIGSETDEGPTAWLSAVPRAVARDPGRRLLKHDASEEEFCEALEWLHLRTEGQRKCLAAGALATVHAFSMGRSADRVLALYDRLVRVERAKGYEADRDAGSQPSPHGD